MSIAPSFRFNQLISPTLFSISCLIAVFEVSSSFAEDSNLTQTQKIEGMLMGSFIGDAAGGPPEFQAPKRSRWTTQGKPLTKEAIKELASLYKMEAYGREAAPYGQWIDFAPAGTITDDSRHKILFIQSVGKAKNSQQTAFAESMVHWYESESMPFARLRKEALREYVKAAYWVLGDQNKGKPLQHLWGGIPTQAGQMYLLPVAGLHPGHPLEAYKETYEINFVDVGIAKDINAALVAGLAEALNPNADWHSVRKAMVEIDPHEYGNVPWVERRFTYWLNKAKSLAKQSGGDPKKLFTLLEDNLETRQWWEAWVPHTVFFSIAEITNYDPLATLQVINEFGYDTDSYSQLGGAFFGALHGSNIFPKEMRDLVKLRLKEQLNVEFDDLVETMIMHKRSHH